MEIENGPKIYCCYDCDYYTSKKNHYTRHLTTAKHINRLNGNNYGKEKGQKGATCNMCLKTFKSSSGLWKHKQKCNIQEKIEEKIEEIQEDTKETELKSMIVKKRNLNKNNSINSFYTSSDDNSDNEENIKKNNIKKNNKYLAKQITKNINNDICYVQDKNNDKITLSYLLNVIDGIRETPGRILIITSNHYNQLDEALIRPGRIDIKLEMKNASVNTISQMYCHYYDEVLDTNFIEKLVDHKISPAQITNIYLNSKNQDEFKNNLLEIF